ncbi:penicillin-binding transpeptidase domain-containing protein [Clostridium botulinum]|uniref:penicillin-binding transpeptidase domain-containing protein n=1 Tax=Clostridium botulinum TaxID=1491 RepID=UPI001966D669|nr:penicillin-binding transpeptidase domain-containing protein [Clostridium botulinum]MBN1057461.1 penicillin-binding transpeptidase domain-containing protein [Clostridium botulinum]MBN1060707.1 penicillin-binding transpeptidase domain-containing protein [Clostridium botulinum]
MEKKIKRIFIFSLIGIGILVVSAFIFASMKANSINVKQSEKLAQEYFQLLNEKKYDLMYDKLSDESKDKISKEDFIERNKNIYEGIGASDININDIKVKVNGSNILAAFQCNMNSIAGILNINNTIHINRIYDEFKIDWSSNLIFPELNDDYKVKVKITESRRGDILDRNNIKLATDDDVAEIGIVIEELGENKKESINEIANVLQVPSKYIDKKLNEPYVKPYMFVPIKVVSYSNDIVNKVSGISGVYIKDKPSRVYPLEEKAAHLIGYIQNVTAEDLEKNSEKSYSASSVIGRSGIESIYEERLRGIDGIKINIVNKHSDEVKVIYNREVKNGEDIKLTIDSNLQQVAYNALEDNKGATVNINPNTGEVLSLVSTPSYNPNDFVLGLSTDKWNELNTNESKPLYNRFQSNITPGSAFKPITAAIGIESNVLNPNDDKGIVGLKWQKDDSWGGYKITRVKDYGFPSNLENALIFSDNIYFARVALDVGAENFEKKLKEFGIGEKIPFEYGVSVSQFSSKDVISNEILLADSGYGQGDILMNPLQLAITYTMFTNEGNILKPYLEYKENNEKNIWKSNVISKETSKIILNDLESVVNKPSGSAHGLYEQDINISAKTGTAEVKLAQDDENGTEIGWVVATTTNKDTNILVTTFVEDVKGKGGSGYVIPIVKKVIQEMK